MAQADPGYHLDVTAPRSVAAQSAYVAGSQAVSLDGAQLDVPYGEDPRQSYDVFPAGKAAPAIVFFHGGYWRAGTKEARRFPADIWRENGVCWITVEYRLCPDVPLSALVDDASAALHHIMEHASDYGIDPAQIHLTGNSAGAHLAAMVAATIRTASLTVVSGLFDLDPLRTGDQNAWLRLDAVSAKEMSPIHGLPDPRTPVIVTCGGDESAAFKAQSTLYGTACAAQGNPVEHFEVAGADHFEVIGHYARADSPLFRAIHAQINQHS